jgi:type VI secretion system protein ImpA
MVLKIRDFIMRVAETVNLEQILAPISEENQIGEDLRSDLSPAALYYQIKDTRSLARAAERQAMQDGESATPAINSWKMLADLCVKALSEQTKDLEIACWLVEALVRTNGFDGLTEGFRLLRNLVENYWPEMYPNEEQETGWATKLAALIGLNGENNPGTLVAPIHCIPITAQDSGGRVYATWEYLQALEISKLADQEAKKQRIAGGAVTLEQIQAAIGLTNKEFYVELDADLKNCTIEFNNLYQVLAEKSGEFCPPSANIRHALEDCAAAVKALTKNVLAAEGQEQSDSNLNDADQISGLAEGISTGSGDRKALFQQIAKIADFFRRTEPHSPLSYLLERAVRWGDMTLPDLMKELLGDPNSYFGYCKLVGIEPPKPQTPAQAGPAPYMPDAGMGGYNPNPGFNSNPVPYGNEQFGMPPNSPGFNNF